MAPPELAVLEDWKEVSLVDFAPVEACDPRQSDETDAALEMMFAVPAFASPREPAAVVERSLVPGPRWPPAVKPPSPREAPPVVTKRTNLRVCALFTLFASLTGGLLGWGLWPVSHICHPAGQEIGGPAAAALASLIVQAESNGRAEAKNERSSATGAGQFLDGTWLELISAYRPDLEDAPKEKILALRQDTGLSQDMVVRLARRNAKVLAARCLPVTPGTLYLAHFAGGGGAASVLSSPDHADAAAAMAEGDSRGKLTREMILAANPFLKSFTVAKLKSWADRKMESAALLVARRS